MRRLRTQRGLSHSEFAGLLSAFGPPWAKGKVIALETGKRDSVTIDELCQLSGCLRAPLTEFFAGTGDMSLNGLASVERESLRRALDDTEVVRLDIDSPDAFVAFQAQVDEDLLAFDLALRLNQPLKVVRSVAARLFGRNLTAERDARVGDLVDPDTIAYRRREVSKQLARELGQAIDQEDRA